jgi:hypothetical protein
MIRPACWAIVADVARVVFEATGAAYRAWRQRPAACGLALSMPALAAIRFNVDQLGQNGYSTDNPVRVPAAPVAAPS